MPNFTYSEILRAFDEDAEYGRRIRGYSTAQSLEFAWEENARKFVVYPDIEPLAEIAMARLCLRDGCLERYRDRSSFESVFLRKVLEPEIIVSIRRSLTKEDAKSFDQDVLEITMAFEE